MQYSFRKFGFRTNNLDLILKIITNSLLISDFRTFVFTHKLIFTTNRSLTTFRLPNIFLIYRYCYPFHDHGLRVLSTDISTTLFCCRRLPFSRFLATLPMSLSNFPTDHTYCIQIERLLLLLLLLQPLNLSCWSLYYTFAQIPWNIIPEDRMPSTKREIYFSCA